MLYSYEEKMLYRRCYIISYMLYRYAYADFEIVKSCTLIQMLHFRTVLFSQISQKSKLMLEKIMSHNQKVAIFLDKLGHNEGNDDRRVVFEPASADNIP